VLCLVIVFSAVLVLTCGQTDRQTESRTTSQIVRHADADGRLTYAATVSVSNNHNRFTFESRITRMKPGFHSNATQAIAFEWKPGFSRYQKQSDTLTPILLSTSNQSSPFTIYEPYLTSKSSYPFNYFLPCSQQQQTVEYTS